MNKQYIAHCIFGTILIVTALYVFSIAVTPFILPSTLAVSIWPAAGISASVLILWGKKYFHAVVLGEIFINLRFYEYQNINDGYLYVSYISLLMIAISRAVISAYLVRTHLGQSNRYFTTASVAKLFLFAGIIPGLFSSTASNLILHYSGMLATDTAIKSTLSWWFGDTIGIIIILPMMLLLFRKPRHIWKPRLLRTLIPMIITLILIISVSLKVKDLEQKKIITSLDSDASRLVDLIMNELSDQFPVLHRNSPEEIVSGMNRLFTEYTPEITKDEPLSGIDFMIFSFENDNRKLLYDSERLADTSYSAKASRFCDIAGHLWEIEAYATADYYLQKGGWLTWWLLSIGFIFTALLGAGLLVVTGNNQLIREKVKKRTKEIETLNKLTIDRERRYKKLVEVQPVIFWKHVRGDKKLTYMSDELMAILGYSEKSLIDLDTIWNTVVHPEDKNRILSEYLEGVKSGQRFTLIYRLVCKNGEVIWFKDFISTKMIDGQVEVFGMKIDITKDQQREQKISQLAYYDSMTQLPNRVLFLEYLNEAIKEAVNHQYYGAVMFLDLNRFKVLNDSMGHYFGDQLLIRIGERLKKLTSEENIISRFGGDEFVMLISPQRNTIQGIEAEARSWAKKVQNLIKQPFNIDGHQFYTSFSIGVSIFPNEKCTAEQVLQQADIAMYASKKNGNSAISFFKPAMQERANRRLRIEKSLKNGLVNNEFEMYFQPIFGDDKTILKLESLIRWNHPEAGLVYPNSFIEIAEETGFILELSEWIIDHVFCCVAQWPVTKINRLPISINISLFQFSNTKLIEVLQAASEKYSINTSQITLELTESIGVDHFVEVLEKLQQLKKMGFQIAIDDFGSGYSSLNYLAQMPIDIVKLKKSFTSKIGQDSNTETLIETIVMMAKQLRLDIIVEGVETEQQFEFLKSLGCKKFQGHMISQALPINELQRFLLEYDHC